MASKPVSMARALVEPLRHEGTLAALGLIGGISRHQLAQSRYERHQVRDSVVRQAIS